MNTKIITGCDDCPCCDANDMCGGYNCQLLEPSEGNLIQEKKYGGPKTPRWCPLIKDSLLLKFQPKNKPDEFSRAVSELSKRNTAKALFNDKK